MKIVKRYGWILILIILIVFMSLKVPAVSEEKNITTQINSMDTVTEKTSENKEMMVDIKGEVMKPGVYKVTAGMRVNDVIQMAGGLTNNADPTSVNLAQKLQDEMVVLVTNQLQALTDSALDSSSKQIALNQATSEEIQTLSGIGPSKAKAIIDYREKNGPFQKKEDLLNVSGIGEATFENIQEQIRIP